MTDEQPNVTWRYFQFLALKLLALGFKHHVSNQFHSLSAPEVNFLLFLLLLLSVQLYTTSQPEKTVAWLIRHPLYIFPGGASRLARFRPPPNRHTNAYVTNKWFKLFDEIILFKRSPRQAGAGKHRNLERHLRPRVSKQLQSRGKRMEGGDPTIEGSEIYFPASLLD